MKNLVVKISAKNVTRLSKQALHYTWTGRRGIGLPSKILKAKSWTETFPTLRNENFNKLQKFFFLSQILLKITCQYHKMSRTFRKWFCKYIYACKLDSFQ